MKNLHWKILLIVGVIAVCIWQMVPVSENIRLGKDLRGGVSLIYQVHMPEDVTNREDVITQVITVLKDRVNPGGVLDISMTPMGLDRIEIVMPLPNQDVQNLRAAFDDELNNLLEMSEIQPGVLDRAIREGNATEVFNADPSTSRGARIQEMQDAYNTLQDGYARLDEAKSNNAPPEAIAGIEQEIADAEIALEGARESVLRLSLPRGRVLNVLRLSTERENRIDEVTGRVVRDEDGDPIKEPSPRTSALEQIRRDYPHLADQIDAVVAAWDTYQANRRGLDDKDDLIRLLRGAGVLEFRITVRPSDTSLVNIAELRQQLREVGPENAHSPTARWFPLNDLKQWYDEPAELAALNADPEAYFSGRGYVVEPYEGMYYMLLHDSLEKKLTHEGGREWSVQRVFQDVDALGRDAVSFRLDSAGGVLMSQLTGRHVGQFMAIVLDDQVYSAPVLESQIGSSGIIQGEFSPEDISYLIRVLAAGSLAARLSAEPIAVNTIGPTLGADNLQRGLEAFMIAVIAVAVFMLLYYFFAGFVADMALLINGVIIFGVMAMIDGTFTLPGLAGIVLTIGMAVDANVLIYERIREELFTGEVDLRGAIRLGYGKALSTIIDANVTNLIVCFVLGKTATTEVKGFAVTLAIGICATLFTALFVTRVIFTLYTEVFRFKSLPMLATKFPAVHRFLEPNIRWTSLRHAFWALSGAAIVLSLIMVTSRGVNMFDTEFRGGVQVTLETRPLAEDAEETFDDNGATSTVPVQRLLLPHTDGEGNVQDRVHALGEAIDPSAAPAGTEEHARLLALREMANASVLTVGDTVVGDDGYVYATSFQIKVANPKGIAEDQSIADFVVGALEEEFGNQLDIKPSITFDGAGTDEFRRHAYPITQPELGKNIERPQVTDRVTDFLGGVAVVLSNFDPPATTGSIATRIENMRGQPDFARYAGRTTEVIGLEAAGTNDQGQSLWSEVAVLVSDTALSYVSHDRDMVDQRLAQPEWEIINAALTQRSGLDQVSDFSSAIAQTLSATAVVAVVLTLLAILAYIWVRFGSLRYSAAAIAALVHDVIIALGLLAFTGLFGNSAFARALGIEEFRIDLGVVAALLTIIGYSLNDTIVILDRIRENRGKLPVPTADIVDKSINQTVSRTLLTSFTTLMAIFIMYVEGGSGIRPFAFCLLTGLIVGTYSSVAIAAPLVYRGKTSSRRELEDETAGESAVVV